MRAGSSTCPVVTLANYSAATSPKCLVSTIFSDTHLAWEWKSVYKTAHTLRHDFWQCAQPSLPRMALSWLCTASWSSRLKLALDWYPSDNCPVPSRRSRTPAHPEYDNINLPSRQKIQPSIPDSFRERWTVVIAWPEQYITNSTKSRLFGSTENVAICVESWFRNLSKHQTFCNIVLFSLYLQMP